MTITCTPLEIREYEKQLNDWYEAKAKALAENNLVAFLSDRPKPTLIPKV